MVKDFPEDWPWRFTGKRRTHRHRTVGDRDRDAAVTVLLKRADALCRLAAKNEAAESFDGATLKRARAESLRRVAHALMLLRGSDPPAD